MKLSIVIPVYNEEKNLDPLYNELKQVLKDAKKEHEIIFVDDGSTDKSFFILSQIASRDKKVRVIKFRRNFGQTAALDAGFKAAKFDVIMTLDADMQNDPHDIPNLLAKIDEGYDIVSGWRWNRKDSFSKRIFSRFAAKLRKLLTDEKIHDSGCTLKAYRKECFDDIVLYGEAHRFIPTLLRWKGFKVAEVKVNHRQRKFGKTKYGFSRVLRGFLDLLTLKFWQDYSMRPLHFFGKIGLINILVGILLVIYNLIEYGLKMNIGPTLLASLLFILVGIQFFGFGFLAEIQIRMYYSDKKKSYEIEKVLGK